MADNVSINGRAAIHKGSAGKSIAFPDVCLCPPGPPTGPIPTPLVNTAQATDLQSGALTVTIEGNPIAHNESYIAKSTGRLLDWTQLWSSYSCDEQKIHVEGATVTVITACEERCLRTHGRSPPSFRMMMSDEDGQPLADGTCPYPLVGAGCEGDGYSDGPITELCKLSPDRWGELRKRVTYTYGVNGERIESSMRVEYLDDPDQCNRTPRRPR
jgi:hypothetical protein